MTKAEDKAEKGAGKGPPAKDANDAEDLSAEDRELKERLEEAVESVLRNDIDAQKASIGILSDEVRESTSSMTAVPKPLRFLKPFYGDLKQHLEGMAASTPADVRRSLAELVSVLAMTAQPESRECLKYRIVAGSEGADAWGHEYLRHLAGECGQQYAAQTEAGESTADVMNLVKTIVAYQMGHGAEPEAVDLALEVEAIRDLVQHADATNYRRTCLYLVSCCSYLPDPDNTEVLEVAYDIYMKVEQYTDAMRLSLRLNDPPRIRRTFATCSDVGVKKQLCYLLGRQGAILDLEDGECAVSDSDLVDTLREIMSNSKLSTHYLSLARDLDVLEPRKPEDVFKLHLLDGNRGGAALVDSARGNLASSFVNAFVNAGFGTDTLLTAEPAEGEVSWVFKNREHMRISATASLGMLGMWDVEGGLPLLDKYLYVEVDDVKAGALLGVGVLCANVRHETDPALAILSEYVGSDRANIRTGAIMGLGLAYAGTCREDLKELLLPVITDAAASMEIVGYAAMSVGLIFAGAMPDDATSAILQVLMIRSEDELSNPHTMMVCLGLGLMFLGRQASVDATVEITKTLSDRIALFAQICVETCAFAGSGNVLRLQELLAHLSTEPPAAGAAAAGAAADQEAWKSWHQAPAVIGIALIAMGEELGSSMAYRMFEHLLQYGGPVVRRAVPLALGLLNVSNPEIGVVDILSRLSHDVDSSVAIAAALSLGLVGAGTNNSRLAGLLRSLGQYHSKDPTALLMVRVAQGLIHAGKGLLTFSPYHTERQLLSLPALGGILGVLYAALLPKITIGGKHHMMLFYLSLAMFPRMLMLLDEEGNMVSAQVRVGQAVDVVAQAGRPKAITGFQTYTTPILVGHGERAELATEQYLAQSSILEGVVIVRPNPDYVD
ncbi:unnamed protein product [Pedinophyceae sp. YPF-701]|nr:unnamed protein product [Pedinophyceae sp. YPF-701]